MIARTLFLGAALVTSGCLIGEVSGIPCERDGACPSDYFCDLPRSECREITDTFGPPVLTVKRIADPSGTVVTTPFLPPELTSTIALLPENIGLAPAENVALTFAELACFEFNIDETTLPAVVAADETGSITVDVTPAAGCEGLTIIDWFLTYSGRETRGTFDINVKAE